MLFELIATVTAGFAGGGLALLVRKLAPGLPRWLVPLTAGAAMLLSAITLEYSWYTRTAGALPEGVEVALTHENRAPWRPWTYLRPYVDRFVAVDRASTRAHEDFAGQRMVDLYFFGRWSPPQRLQAVFDCEAGRRADLVPGARIGEGGAIEGTAWHETGLDDPVTRTACREV